MRGNDIVNENKCTIEADTVNPVYQSKMCKKYGFLVDGKPMDRVMFTNVVNHLTSVNTEYGYAIKIMKEGSDLYTFLEMLKDALQKALPGKPVHNRCKNGYAFITISNDYKVWNEMNPVPHGLMDDVLPKVKYLSKLIVTVTFDFCEVKGNVYIKPVIRNMRIQSTCDNSSA